MTREPDAWDECGICGHDRDDHYGPHGDCMGYLECGCRAFQDDEPTR